MNTAGTLAAFLKTLPPSTPIYVDSTQTFDVVRAPRGVEIKPVKPKKKAEPAKRRSRKAEGAKA